MQWILYINIKILNYIETLTSLSFQNYAVNNITMRWILYINIKILNHIETLTSSVFQNYVVNILTMQ